MKRFWIVLFFCTTILSLIGNKTLSDFKSFENAFFILYENFSEENQFDTFFKENNPDSFSPDEKAYYYFYYSLTIQKNNKQQLKNLQKTLQLKGLSTKCKNLVYFAQANIYLSSYWDTAASYPLFEKVWQYVQKNPNEFTEFEKIYIQTQYIYSLVSVEQNEKASKISLQLLQKIDAIKEKKTYYLACINAVILANVEIGDPLILFKATRILEQLPKKSTKSYLKKQAILTNNLGQSNIILGNYDEALKHQLEAKKILDQLGINPYFYEWYWHMAWLNGEIGNYDEAMSYLKKAKKLIYNDLTQKSYDYFLINTVDFEIKIENRKKEEAKTILDSLKLLNTQYKYLGNNENFTLKNCEALYNFENKDFKKSKIQYKYLIDKISNNNEDFYRIHYYEYYYFYLKSLIELHEIKLAKTEYQKILPVIKQNPNNKNAFNILLLYSKIYSDSSFETLKNNYNYLCNISTFSFIHQAMAQKELAKLYFEQYQKTKNKDAIEKSLQHIQLAYQQSEKQFNKIQSINDKTNFKNNSKEIIDLGLKIAFTYYKIQPEKAKKPLLLFINQPKFNILKENLEFKTSKNIKNEFTTLTENTILLKNRKDIIEAKLPDKTIDIYKYKLLQEEFDIISEKLKANEQKLKTYSQKYYDLIYSAPKFSNLTIPKNCSLISYHYSNNNLYAFVFQDNTYHFFAISVSNFYKKIIALNKAIENNDNNAIYLENQFYNLIFKPVEQKLKHKNIIISPSEEMLTLNFEVFAQNKNDTNPNYLIEKYNFIYWFSPDFQSYFTSNKKSKNNKLLMISPENFQNFNLTNLSFSNIVTQTLASNFNTTILKNKNATETNFKNNFSGFDNIILATHSIVDSENPAKSFIAFNNQNDKNNDGKLYLNEITENQVQTDFLTLASCNSGNGKIMTGLGNFSFANSFAYTGVKSILFSNWKIDEKTTLQIISVFYENLKKGYSKSEALRKAKLDFIKQSKDPKLKNPYYWGGLIIVGNDNSVFEKQNSSLLYFSLAVFMVLLLSDFIFYRK